MENREVRVMRREEEDLRIKLRREEEDLRMKLHRDLEKKKGVMLKSGKEQR